MMLHHESWIRAQRRRHAKDRIHFKVWSDVLPRMRGEFTNNVDQCDDFDPGRLLSKNEKRLAMRLLKASKRPLVNDDRSESEIIAAQLARIAESTALRCLRIERHMVLRIQRDDQYVQAFQVQQIRLDERYGCAQFLTWALRGRALRKDGKLGSKYEGMNFTRASIERRLLTGEWVRLRPLLSATAAKRRLRQR